MKTKTQDITPPAPFWPGPAMLACGITVAMLGVEFGVWQSLVLGVLIFFGLLAVERFSSFTPRRDAPSVTGRATYHEDYLPHGRRGVVDSARNHASQILAPAPRWGSANPLS